MNRKNSMGKSVSFQFRNEQFSARSRKTRGCAEAYRGTSHKQTRSLTPIQPFSRSAVVAEATMAKSARSQCFGEVGS